MSTPSPLAFVTTNGLKFAVAEAACQNLSIKLEQIILEIDELQGEDAERIIRDKANKAYRQLQRPVLVSDDSWDIPGLGGFPGPYMKSMNYWFSPEDFLRLTLPLKDRSATFWKRMVYQDAVHQQLFEMPMAVTIFKEVRGHSNMPSESIFGFNSDNGLTIAEVVEQGVDLAGREGAAIWREIDTWFKQNERARS